MSRIRSKGTKPEESLDRIVRTALGGRWRVDRNARLLPGVPDVVIPGLKVCIFVDGCFFHMCPVHYRPPKTRGDYWVPKLHGNVRRDHRYARRLRKDGWAVWRIWEHDLRPSARDATALRLKRRLHRRRNAIKRTASLNQVLTEPACGVIS
jgi:DNA mismatch endonuclease (patch repair protein)